MIKNPARIITLFLVFLLTPLFYTFGMNVNDTIKVKRNTVYLEGFGNGGLYSLNYDRILYYRPKLKVSSRAGFGIISGFDFISFPVEVNLIRGDENCLELGLSASYIKGLQKGTIFEPDFDNFVGDYISSSIYGSLRIGYRYQRKEGGFTFRIGFTPLIKFHEFNRLPKQLVKNQPVWGGISFGYAF
jgi:hypothetical protein